jgi:hypothetical protein
VEVTGMADMAGRAGIGVMEKVDGEVASVTEKVEVERALFAEKEREDVNHRR